MQHLGLGNFMRVSCDDIVHIRVDISLEKLILMIIVLHLMLLNLSTSGRLMMNEAWCIWCFSLHTGSSL